MKKIICLLLISAMLISFAGCGGNGEVATTTENTETVAEKETEATKIETADGILEYTGIEKAYSTLITDLAENVWLVKFNYSPKHSEPAQCQYYFDISFFQNGVELENSLSYSSDGGRQYELVSNYFLEAIEGGTLEFARIVQLKDDSELKVFLGSDTEKDNKVSFTIDIASEIANSESAKIDAATVKEKLQGVWSGISQGSEVSLDFSGDNVTFSAGGLSNPGTYEIDEDNAVIKVKIDTATGVVSIKVPYVSENGELKLLNDNLEEVFFKQ